MSLSEAHHTGIQGVDEHREFVDAISRRDASQATAIMARHLQRTAARVAKP
jgi:DNA-binding GntR family transcriptional regulator